MQLLSKKLYKTGRLKEVSMSLKSDGVVDSATSILCIRLWKHSKINPFELVVPQNQLTVLMVFADL